MHKGRILVADDEVILGNTLKKILGEAGYMVDLCHRGEEFFQHLTDVKPEIVILDIYLGNVNGIQLLNRMKVEGWTAPVIMMTAHSDVSLAVRAMKEGAADFVVKPFDLSHLAVLIEKNLEHARLQTKVRLLEEELDEQGARSGIIGRSATIHKSLETSEKLAQGENTTVLLEGESGTGKELFARYIHQKSARADKPFVTVNCGAIPKDLAESEFFGYEKGAFTGATERMKQGKFELADGGTILLDEVRELSLEMQVKLLRVLEEKRIRRLGGHEVITLDVRVITATHANLEKAVEDRRFRPDLYYRLNDAVIRVPSLRERRDDIPALVASFLLNHPRSAQLKPVVTDEAMEFLKHCDWPGNVRELKNVVYKAVMEAHGYPIDIPMLRKVMKESRLGEPGTQQKLEAHVSSLLVKASQGRQNDVRAAVHEWAERELYTQAWTLADGDQTRLAKWLGVSRPTVRQKLKTFGLREPTAAEVEGK